MKNYHNLVVATHALIRIYLTADKKGEDNAQATLERIIELFNRPEYRNMVQASEEMTLVQYQELAQRTLPVRGRNHFFDAPSPDAGDTVIDSFTRNIDLLHASLKLPSEVGEMLDPIARAMFYGKALGTEQIDNIKEEAGDLLWYIASPLCRALGCTIEELARANIAKLQKRYPDTYSDQAALARADKEPSQ